MIPRSKHIAIVVAVTIALLAGLLFARSVTGRTDNIAAVASFATEVIAPTSTHAALPAEDSATTKRKAVRDMLIQEVNTAP